MYDVYIVEYDDGQRYDNFSYIVGAFDTFKKAENYCLSKGYSKTEIECDYKKDGCFSDGYLHIFKANFNEIINEPE